MKPHHIDPHLGEVLFFALLVLMPVGILATMSGQTQIAVAAVGTVAAVVTSAKRYT